MHSYRQSEISARMLMVRPDCPEIDLYVADAMMKMAGIESVPGGGSLVGWSLVLGVGQSPFACALGSRDFGHEVLGVTFHAADVHQQNFWRNRLRSRTRFAYSTPEDLLLAVPVFTWDFVFVLQYVNWLDISDFVLARMEKPQVIVAQQLPVAMELEGYEHAYVRTTARKYCHEAESIDDAEYVIFKVR